jgi:hypothetical protein
MSNDRFLLDAAFTEHRTQYPTVTSIGDAFEIFCSDLILKRRRLSINEIIDGVVGGGKDGGLDGIYVFVNGALIEDKDMLPDHKSGISIEVVFLQAKHSKDMEQVVLQKLESSLPLFLDLEPDQVKMDIHFNSDVQAKAQIYRNVVKKYAHLDHKVLYKIYYGSRSANPPTAAFNDLADSLVSICERQLGTATCEFTQLGATELYKANVSPQHVTRPITLQPASYIDNDNHFIALVRLRDFLSFITDEGGHLDQNMFEFNVRDYEGDTKPVNKGIALTITNPEPDSDFWWYNNGVTVVASKADVLQRSLVVHDPMIVNGLQTANVLFANRAAILENSEDDRRIVLRVISLEKQELRDGVIKATNSQTNLSALALRATDEYQRKIEAYLETQGYFYERRKNYHKNRGVQVSKIIDMARLGQSVMALNLNLPHEARARPGSFLNKLENYNKIFPNGLDMARFAKAASLERKLDDWLRSNRTGYDALYRNNLRYHTLMVLAWDLMGAKSKKTGAVDLNKATDENIKNTFEWVVQEYKTAGGVDDTLSKTKEFTTTLATNWTNIRS